MSSPVRSNDDAGNRVWLAVAIAAIVAMRLVLVFVHRIDSDEPQHLHVAWGWSQGLVQYRDLFDNHLPLLHLLFAPLLAFVPEGSTVFTTMRLAIAPFPIACVWLVYVIAKPFRGPRVAALGALTLSLLPAWFSRTVEFRNDTLWVFLWLVALAIAVRKQRVGSIATGIFLGLCFLASVKAVPLVLAHLLAIAIQGWRMPVRGWVRLALGMAIPVGLAALFFFAFGALDDLVYSVFFYNVGLPVHPMRRMSGLIALTLIAGGFALARRRFRNPDAAVSTHLLLFSVWFCVLMLCLWPVLSPRDYLPVLAAAGVAMADRWPRHWWRTPLLLAALATGIWDSRIWRPAGTERADFVDAVVRTTGPQDFVFDLKGDAVFRRRPVRPIYDVVGRMRTLNGTIPDRGPEELAARGCCAAVPDMDTIPARTRAFLASSFIDRGAMRVCGAIVKGSGTFTIGVPQTYAVEARDPSVIAIDGVPYRGPRFLSAGPHTLSAPGGETVTIVWARASAPSSSAPAAP